MKLKVSVGLVASALVLIATVFGARSALAQGPAADCGDTRLTVLLSGRPAITLPESAGGTVVMNPDDDVMIVVENPPLVGRADISLLFPFGQRITRSFGWTLGGSETTHRFPFDVSDYPDLVRGVFEIEAALYGRGSQICVVPLTVKVVGFSGIVPRAAAGGAAAAAVVAAGTVAWTATETGGKIKVKAAVQRRRKRGWRRWVPVLAWRRSIISTITGILTGELTILALQQAGLAPLSSGSVVLAGISGGGISLGLGVGFGTLLAYLKPPVDDD